MWRWKALPSGLLHRQVVLMSSDSVIDPEDTTRDFLEQVTLLSEKAMCM